KMSKSYGNTVPLFEGGAKALKAAIAKIVTDSRGPGEPKDADASHLYLIYKAFAQPSETANFHAELLAGMGWGDAKKRLCDRIEQEMGPLRGHYEDLMSHPDRIEEILQEGAGKARSIATPFIHELRQAVGLRSLATSRMAPSSPSTKKEKSSGKSARYVTFRDEAGQFRFRLLAQDGAELFCSIAFADPKLAGAAMRALQQAGAQASIKLEGDLGLLIVQGEQVIAKAADSATVEQREQLIAALTLAMQTSG
ncbi:MAG: tryptophan--tRNA ligase, partial [Alcaligenaceae bacterium]